MENPLIGSHLYGLSALPGVAVANDGKAFFISGKLCANPLKRAVKKAKMFVFNYLQVIALDKVLSTIEKYHMIKKGDRILVGVSGGADSLALLHILVHLQASLSIQVYAAHVNHGLRGDEAKADALFVEEKCREWGVPFFLKEEDVHHLSKVWRISEESAGRVVRYQFFEQVLNEIGGHKIALAHHRDDQAETILHHIIRGTGMKGLQGMSPVRDGKYIRPLLEVSRAEIEEYCRKNKLEFRVDRTNQESCYTRNKIRHLLIPFIAKEFNPNISETLVRMAEILREEEDFLQGICAEISAKICRAKEDLVEIEKAGFLSCHRAVKRRILRLSLEKLQHGLQELQLSHIDGVIDLVESSSVGSMLYLPGNILAYHDYDVLRLSIRAPAGPVGPIEYPLKIPGSVKVPEMGIEVSAERIVKKGVLEFQPMCIFIDGDVVSGDLKVRNRRDGDRFKPIGMKGTKKLKDYFIDKKIPRLKRDLIPLVADERNIIWVAGYQIHDDYKIRDGTRNIIKIQIREERCCFSQALD